MINVGGILRDKAIRQLYDQTEKSILSVLGKMGLEKMEIEETTDDALIICIDNICRGKFRRNASLNTYIVGIAKNCALNLLRKNQRRRNLDMEESNETALSPEDLVLIQEKRNELHLALDELGDPCRQLLLLWAGDYAYREIIEIMEYKSENSAKVQKYKCLKRLISIFSRGTSPAGE